MTTRLDAAESTRYRRGDYTLPGYYDLLQCRRVVLLQGPMGTFLNRIARWLAEHDVDVRKINFNGGDWLFHRHLHATDYRGKLAAFPAFLGEYLAAHGIDGIVCFGDCRHYHSAAATLAAALGIPFFVFEEGYVRPDYVTLERGGVNAFSKLPRSAAFYRALPEVDIDKPHPAAPSFGRAAWSAMLYYGAARLLRWRFPHYRHHKKFAVRYEIRAWVRSWVRKHLNGMRDKPVFDALLAQNDGDYFAVPLQVYNDSQVTRHSAYGDVREFIADVLVSFAAHAGAQAQLVFKHHPMDRGQRDYRRLIKTLSEANGVAGRVHYLHDVHLPTLLRHARGVLMINSTVGLSALYHNKPLIVLGRALYDMPGLTFQGGMAQFWTAHTRVDRVLWRRFRAYLITQTQLNGAFYGRDFHQLAPAARQVSKSQLSAPLATYTLQAGHCSAARALTA